MKWQAVSRKSIYTPALTRAPLSRSSRELLVNSSCLAQTLRGVRKLVVNCSCHHCVKNTRPFEWEKSATGSWFMRELLMNSTWAVRELFVAVCDTRCMACTGTHPPVLSRRVHDQFTTSSRIVHDMVAKFYRDQNFEHLKILVPTLHAVTTFLCTLHVSLRLVCALTWLQSGQCVQQNRASVSLALLSLLGPLRSSLTVICLYLSSLIRLDAVLIISAVTNHLLKHLQSLMFTIRFLIITWLVIMLALNIKKRVSRSC